MEITLNIEGEKGLKKRCIKDGKWKHEPGKSIQMLPFRTKFNSASLEDLHSFQGIVGECIRLGQELGFPSELKSDEDNTFRSKIKEHILTEVKTKVATDYKDVFKDIVIKLFFDKNHNLIKFNRRVLPYLNFSFEHNHLKEIAKFFFDIFFLDEGLMINSLTKSSNDNIFYQLIMECLPELKTNKTGVSRKYVNLFEEIADLFKKDLAFLTSDEDLFLNHVEDLFQYYYFFYITQLTRGLNSLGKKNINPVFFSMDWETLSESRLAYRYGWKALSDDIGNLFSHVNALEILNYITIDDQELGDYKNLRNTWKKLNDSEQSKLVGLINQSSQIYIDHVEGLFSGESWKRADEQIFSYMERNKGEIEHDLDKALILLFKRIKYQFENSERKAAHERYGKWIDLFIRKSFTKTRGRLGSTTVLSQEYLLFLVKLCVGNNDKIRLNSLWEQLKIRGISFDEPSKNEIIKLFERINLLEKKSDSGDAQYVKSSI